MAVIREVDFFEIRVRVVHIVVESGVDLAHRLDKEYSQLRKSLKRSKSANFRILKNYENSEFMIFLRVGEGYLRLWQPLDVLFLFVTLFIALQ